MPSSVRHPVSGALAERARKTVAELRGEAGLQALWRAARNARRELAARAEEICRIPAPTFQEEARGDWAARFWAEQTGAKVEVDALGNRWVRLNGTQAAPRTGRRLLVCAHLDTVFPEGSDCRVRHEAGRLIGPGIGDNGAGLSILLTATRLLCQAGRPFSGELLAAANVGEEGLGNLRGIRALCERFAPELDGVLALDGGLGHVVGKAVGVVRYRVRIRGPGGHSWSDFGRPSALHHLAHVAASLCALEAPAEPRTAFNVGMIQGGTSINTIAPEAELLLDLRSVDAATLARLDAQAQTAIRAKPLPPELDLQVERIGERPTGDPALAGEWVAIGRAAWEALDIPVKVTAGSTDANVPLAMGLRASTLGTHRGGRAHTVSEWLDPTSLPIGLEAFLLATLAALRILPHAGANGKAAENGGGVRP